MRNKLAILILLILFIVSISCVSAEDSNSVSVLSGSNSDVYVSPTGNDNNVGDVNNPFATINKAIDSNVSNIHLSEGKFIGTGNNGLTIENKSITIIGAGADKTIIDLNKTQFMDIKSTSSVVLTNLTIINGYTKYGGAIYNNGNLTIQNCNFKNNSATSGGAIYNNGTLDIYYSTFEDNVVTDRGGAIFSYSYVGIYDSTFIRNKGTGTSSTGGSIYINGNSNKYSVLNRNIFKDTSVARQGGAIYLSHGNVTNCIFENASTTATGSSYGGGAIYGSSFNLKNNTMTNCVAKSGNGNYIFASYDFNGVVTILEGKTVDITSSTFTLNATVTDDMGHPIHGGSYTFYLDDIRIGSASSVNGFINGTFSKLLDDGKYTVTVSGPLNDNAVVKKATANVKIDRDYVDYYVSPGGDDVNNDGSKDKPFKTINKAITEAFAKNIYVNIYLLEGTYSGTGNVNLELTKLLGYLNIIGVDGKTIIDGNGKDYAFNFGTTLNVNLKNIIFTNLYNKKYVDLIKGGSGDFTVNIDNCTFEKCNARYLIKTNGEINNVIMRDNNIASSFISGAVSIDNLLFENNSGNGQISSIEKGIYNSTFINNKITAKSTNDYGIISVSDANFVSSNNVFENNTVKGFSISIGCANFTSINDTFINNAGVTGGAVKGGGTFIHAKFINNTATKGGAIYHDSGALTLKDCIFENNKADDGDDIYGFIATNGMTRGLCLNMSNTLTLVSTNSSSIKSELKAIFDLGGLKVSGYNIKFYLNGVYKGSAPLVNSVATFVAVANDGKYEISASGDYINKTTVVNGVLNVDANPVSVFDVYVSGTGSDESGDGSLAKPFATIKKAFEYGMSQNTLSLIIHIIGTLKGEGNVNLDLAPLIDLTIVGENKETSIIDAEKNKYIFDFTPAYDNVKVYLKNLTIKNGVTTKYPSQGGSATVDVGLVRIDGYYLNVDNCVFRNTTGHGISADKLFSTLIVNNTKFIESSGGVSSARALNVIVANTEFINCNLGVNNNGRTVYLTGLIAVNDIFISSSSIPRYNVTQVLLDNVTFDGNYNGTKTVGSALYLKGTNTTVINSKFINLKDISAIYAFSSSGYKCNVTIIDTYFENNTRDIDYGYGQTNDYRPIFWLINSTFINSGAFACPDGRYQDAWWVVNNTKFINMTNQVLFRGSVSFSHKDDPYLMVLTIL